MLYSTDPSFLHFYQLPQLIQERVNAWNEEIKLDQTRLNQEVVYYADRLDVTEEITRLKAHLEATRGLLAQPPRPAGRKMEFLLQEQMREVTTIGNKARTKEIGALVVRFKTEYEKIREQALNIE